MMVAPSGPSDTNCTNKYSSPTGPCGLVQALGHQKLHKPNNEALFALHIEGQWATMIVVPSSPSTITNCTNKTIQPSGPSIFSAPPGPLPSPTAQT